MMDNLSKIYNLNNIINESRDSRNDGLVLVGIHRKLGNIIGFHFLNRLVLKPITIEHVQGVQECVAYDTAEVVIISLMRGGLFLAEGIWETIKEAKFILYNDVKDIEKHKHIIKGRKILIVDSVINNGTSVNKVISEVENINKDITIVSAVTQEKFESKYDLITIRISNNKYKGVKNLDTGNRLFNTKEID